MPRSSHLNPDAILRFLQVSADSAAAGEISRALRLRKSDQRALFKMLGKLKKRGAIDEIPGGRYRLAGRKTDRQAPREAQLPSPDPRRQGQALTATVTASRDESPRTHKE